MPSCTGALESMQPGIPRLSQSTRKRIGLPVGAGSPRPPTALPFAPADTLARSIDL